MTKNEKERSKNGQFCKKERDTGREFSKLGKDRIEKDTYLEMSKDNGEKKP